MDARNIIFTMPYAVLNVRCLIELTYMLHIMLYHGSNKNNNNKENDNNNKEEDNIDIGKNTKRRCSTLENVVHAMNCLCLLNTS